MTPTTMAMACLQRRQTWLVWRGDSRMYPDKLATINKDTSIMSNETTTSASASDVKKIPAVGQRWFDMDKRVKGRRELVLLQETTTTRQSRDKPQPAFKCAEYRDGVATGKKFVVRVDRLRPFSSGYGYVGEGAPVATIAGDVS